MLVLRMLWLNEYNYLYHLLYNTDWKVATDDKPWAVEIKYYRVSRLVVLPDYQGIGVGKRFLNFIAELYSSQTRMPFYILTSNPQIIKGDLENWKVVRFGHASKGKGNTRINNELRASLSRNRITVSMQYVSANPRI